jgi:phosphinothricin acetyltransferase
MTIRPATVDDASRITDIYNQGIADRGATFETEPRTVDAMRARIEATDRFPLLVAEDRNLVIGWAGLSSYRTRACYEGIAEFSIYLDRAARGQGVGRQLLEALVATARDRGYWKLLSRIFPFNAASRALPRVRLSRSRYLRKARAAGRRVARCRHRGAPDP